MFTRAKKFQMVSPGRKGRAMEGSTLTEALVATVLGCLAIASLATTHATCIRLVRAHKEAAAASQCLQERVEAFRGGNWAQITSASGVTALLQSPAGNASLLPGVVERVSVTTYPPVTPSVAPLQVTRSAAGTVNVDSQPPTGLSLRNFTAVRIDFHLDWSSAQNGRKRTREVSTVVAVGGLLN